MNLAAVKSSTSFCKEQTIQDINSGMYQFISYKCFRAMLILRDSNCYWHRLWHVQTYKHHIIFTNKVNRFAFF